MSQAYSDPKRAEDPHALPDVEVWQEDAIDCPHCDASQPIGVFFDAKLCGNCGEDLFKYTIGQRAAWWWWGCFPGCLPHGEPRGPFETEQEALANAQEGSGE